MQSTTAPSAFQGAPASPAAIAANIALPIFVSVPDVRGTGHTFSIAEIATLTAWPKYFHGLVTLRDGRSMELHRDEFAMVRAAMAAFTLGTGTMPLPARRFFCDVAPERREEYLVAQKELKMA